MVALACEPITGENRLDADLRTGAVAMSLPCCIAWSALRAVSIL
jgi:hypothetical protein